MNEIYQLVRNLEFNFFVCFVFLLLATHILYGLEHSNNLIFLEGRSYPVD